MKLNPSIFRAYDVRGIADRDLTSDLAYALGRAYGSRIRRDGGVTICLGRDCRSHGNRLHTAFAGGVMATGIDVIDVGVVASPMLYFAVFHHDADGGVQITGSHNPADYNGFKMMQGKGSLFGEAIQDLRCAIEDEDFATGEGQISHAPIFDAYVGYITENITLGSRRLKVVVDGGNGTGGPPALAILTALGVDVVPMFIEMDGTFPNHHPDPTVEANLAALKARVITEQADLGLAYDGDADRIGVVDERGEVIWGDRLLILLARDVLATNPGTPVVAEVKCSNTLFDAIETMGGVPIMSAVGHSIIKTRMKKEGALLAGEMSGHIFFAHRWFGFDDAVYASCRLLEILSRLEETLSETLSDVPKTCVTPEIRLDCPDELKFDLVAEAITFFSRQHRVVDIDGARVDFPGGWGLIRASNTQPVVVLRAEAECPTTLQEIRGRLEGFVASWLEGE